MIRALDVYNFEAPFVWKVKGCKGFQSLDVRLS